MISFGVFVSDSWKMYNFGLSFSPHSDLTHTLLQSQEIAKICKVISSIVKSNQKSYLSKSKYVVLKYEFDRSESYQY